MAKPIGTLGTIPTITVGGMVFTDLSTLIVLGTLAGSGNRGTFRNTAASSGYSVTSGKTLTIWAIDIVSTQPTSDIEVTLAYSDNDVGFASATAFTNPVYEFGATNQFHGLAPAYGSRGSWATKFPVPAAKYPGVLNSNGQASIYAYGYEV